MSHLKLFLKLLAIIVFFIAMALTTFICLLIPALLCNFKEIKLRLRVLKIKTHIYWIYCKALLRGLLRWN